MSSSYFNVTDFYNQPVYPKDYNINIYSDKTFSNKIGYINIQSNGPINSLSSNEDFLSFFNIDFFVNFYINSSYLNVDPSIQFVYLGYGGYNLTLANGNTSISIAINVSDNLGTISPVVTVCNGGNGNGGNGNSGIGYGGYLGLGNRFNSFFNKSRPNPSLEKKLEGLASHYIYR